MIATTSPTGTGGVVPLLARALYDAAATMTSFIGLTPLQLVYVVAGLLAALVLWNLGRSLTGKQTWTLDPAHTPGGYVLLPDESAGVTIVELDEAPAE